MQDVSHSACKAAIIFKKSFFFNHTLRTFPCRWFLKFPNKLGKGRTERKQKCYYVRSTLEMPGP